MNSRDRELLADQLVRARQFTLAGKVRTNFMPTIEQAEVQAALRAISQARIEEREAVRGELIQSVRSAIRLREREIVTGADYYGDGFNAGLRAAETVALAAIREQSGDRLIPVSDDRDE